MSALEKIIEGIMAQARAQADQILAGAGQSAGEIRAQGQAERDAYQRRFEESIEPECLEIANRAQSTDRQNRRLALLAVRNQVLGEVLAEAKAKLAQQAGPGRFQVVQQGDILLNNSLDAVFEAGGQLLRDKAYEALTGRSA